MPFPTQLPTSKQESESLILVMLIAGASAFARIMYGKEDIYWRRTFGSVLVAMCVGMGTFSLAAQTLSGMSGYAAVGIGVMSGLFIDDGMKRLHARFLGQPDTEEKRKDARPEDR